MKVGLALVVAASSARLFGGMIVDPGIHPNYDAQIAPPINFYRDPLQTVPQPLTALQLNMQFPQNNYVVAPPDFVGYLGIVNPAQPIVWTTQRRPAEDDLFSLPDVAPNPLTPTPPQPPPEDTPDPQTMLLTGSGLVFVAWRLRVVGASRVSGPRRPSD